MNLVKGINIVFTQFYLFVCLFAGIFSFIWIRKNGVTEKQKSRFVLLFMVLLLTFNFNTNFFNPHNTQYTEFQLDSEGLVTGMIKAKSEGIENTSSYGLGRYDSETKTITPYISQYGLQGKIFQKVCVLPFKQFLVSKAPESLKSKLYYIPVLFMQMICCMATALVLSLIVLLIKRKYNMLLAFCFFIPFWLSPWIVNFARNLYWIEFSWFIPMLLGLVCSLNRHNTKICISCYAGCFISILVKSLCGYEYVTTIMLSMISFLCVDAIQFLKNGKKKELALTVRHIILLGIFALLGFVIALLIHANLKGNGNIMEGLQLIYRDDVLRRTLGGNPDNFSALRDGGYLRKSIEAPIFLVVIRYYYFYTEIISFISGIFFPIFTFLPLIIFGIQIHSRKIKTSDISMYFVFYLTTISWYVLGKAHSYIHTHMNYVLWYFGFVQVCFYVILKQILVLLRLATRYVLNNKSNFKKCLLGKIYD